MIPSLGRLTAILDLYMGAVLLRRHRPSSVTVDSLECVDGVANAELQLFSLGRSGFS